MYLIIIVSLLLFYFIFGGIHFITESGNPYRYSEYFRYKIREERKSKKTKYYVCRKHAFYPYFYVRVTDGCNNKKYRSALTGNEGVCRSKISLKLSPCT